jgi:hypothetical protein
LLQSVQASLKFQHRGWATGCAFVLCECHAAWWIQEGIRVGFNGCFRVGGWYVAVACRVMPDNAEGQYQACCCQVKNGCNGVVVVDAELACCSLLRLLGGPCSVKRSMPPFLFSFVLKTYLE